MAGMKKEMKWKEENENNQSVMKWNIKRNNEKSARENIEREIEKKSRRKKARKEISGWRGKKSYQPPYERPERNRAAKGGIIETHGDEINQSSAAYV